MGAHGTLDRQRNDRLGRDMNVVTSYLNTGGRYNPGTDSWTATSLMSVPLGRTSSHSSMDRQRNDRLGRVRGNFGN